MNLIEPGFLFGAISAFLISLVAGFVVLWLSSYFAATPRLTWEVILDSEFGKSFDLVTKYVEDAAKPGSVDEFKKRLSEQSNCGRLYAVKLKNSGGKPTGPVYIKITSPPMLD